ncbi:MAG TPA: histidine phosphatase family protein [Anaerolineales bacterium]|jgi:2,3-bisphosphoglycerate-dependent phosphoglycerate mutase|nr:histidine phosphatase family protein [Anaerolineales bacterium]
MELYFIRHGQSQNNANWNNPEYKENPDPSLTEHGHEQARLVAEFLKKNQTVTRDAEWNIQNRYGFGLTHIYTSLMERAAFTAAPIAEALDIPLIAWKEIHEEGGIYGRSDAAKAENLPGRPRSFFMQNFRTITLPDDLDETGWWNRPYETEDERQPRAEQVLAELLARHKDQKGQPEHRVAFVSHGGFFMRLMCAMLKLPWRQAAHGLRSWFVLNNCSISRFDIFNDELFIAYINRTDHLPDHLIT